MQGNSDAASTAAGMGVLVFVLGFYAVIFACIIYCYWRVAGKAGYPPYYGLFMIVPVMNIIALVIFVFKDWPIEEELKRLRAMQGMSPGGPPDPGGTAPYYRGPST